LKLLEFKFPKKVKCGIGQYYHFECELAKCDSNINIEDINLKFEIVNEAMKADMDRISKSVLIQSKNINFKCRGKYKLKFEFFRKQFYSIYFKFR